MRQLPMCFLTMIRRALDASRALSPARPFRFGDWRCALRLSGVALRLGVILAFTGTSLVAACGKGTSVDTPSPSPTAILTSPTPFPTSTVTPSPAPAFSPTPFSTSTATLSPTPTISPAPPVATSTQAVPEETTARQLRVFTHLWETVRDTYVFPDFNGLDWDDVKRRYQAVIEAGLEDEAFYQAMREMIDELGDDHSAFYSPEEAAEEEERLSGQLDYLGIGVYIANLWDKNYAVLLQVFPDSPAERAGLQQHDRVLAIDGIPVIDEDGADQLDLLQGPAGSEVQITVQTPGQEPRELFVTRERIQSQLQVQARRLLGTDIGYLLIPTFLDETIAERAREALEGLMAQGELKGLVVDMRINDGGLLTVLEDTLSLFTRGDLGIFVSRDEERTLEIRARPVSNSQELPLVILVGRETVSFAEIFSGLLQESGRAWVVGRTTEGNVEIMWSLDLEDGSRAWIASETFRPPSGADWEESGIIPDQEIPLDWDEFTAETDLQLQAALDWLLQKSEN